MPLSTSSSDRRYLIAFALTFAVLVGAWELVLRARAGETVEFAIVRPQMTVPKTAGDKWLVFGNCLVMTGISPKRLGELVGGDPRRVILNIAAHEASPIAFFEYLRKQDNYPDVVVTNISSWINGTNFDQEAALLNEIDPLGLVATSSVAAKPNQAYREGGASTGTFQREAETALARFAAEHAQVIGHRYHLFDFAMFVKTLATTADLDNALYQLNVQSWFRVTGSDTDGQGYVGLRVDYRADWPSGLDQMAERYLKRMRLARLLTERYWTLLEAHVKDFQQHGTRVLFVRMPEHPEIRTFNDDTYDLPGNLRDFEQRLGVPVLDMSRLGPTDGIHLFDSVHPDAQSMDVLAQRLATWIRSLDLPSKTASPGSR